MSGTLASLIRGKNPPPAAFFKDSHEITDKVLEDVVAEENKIAAATFTGDVTAELNIWLTAERAKWGKDTAFMTAARDFDALASDVIANNKAIYEKLAHSPTLSVEYSLDRQPTVAAAAASSSSAPAAVNPPDLHTGRLIHANRFIGSSDYTLNASASFFGQKPTGAANSWRDYQFGAKFDIPFSGIANLVDKGTLELSGLFVNLKQPPLGVNLTVNGVAVTQPGRIALFQAKYTVPLGNGTGAQLPLSITYSNRTELVKETTVQAGIGITFDMSKLVAAKQASSAQSGK